MKLESLFTRGSNAVKSIAASIKIAEADMKNLQNTYRDLIVSVAIAHQNMKQRPIATAQQKILTNGEQKVQQDSNPIYKNKRDQHAPTSKQNAANSLTHSHNKSTEQTSSSDNHPDSEPTVDRDVDAFDDENNKAPKCNWIYRIVRPAVLVLLVLIIIICIVYFVQPKCCDNLNNLSNSFRPHLQYVRGPPPV
ncbi:nuclear anchorage protein 1-like [Teleopsis dalmanni]|nr:nuclear anchorage protein 1-like [Teleopsis dalmanni]